MFSICELEINTSPLLVCSAQLTLPVSVLLHSSPPTKLLGEREASAALSFSKSRFVTAAGYSRRFLTKVKSFEGCIWWTGVSFTQCPFPPPVTDDLSLSSCVSHSRGRKLCLCLCSCEHWGCSEQRGCWVSAKAPVSPEHTVVAMNWSWLVSAGKNWCVKLF